MPPGACRMVLLECPQCGYITKEIHFISCPGCGGRANETYVEVPDRGESPVSKDAAREGSGYKGLFFQTPQASAGPDILASRMSTMLMVTRTFDDPICLLIEKWYDTLPAGTKRRCDRTMDGLLKAPAGTALSPLIPRERDMLFRKMVEIVARTIGLAKTRPSCKNCTYYMGGVACEIEDIVAAHHAGDTAKEKELVSCKFHAARVDLEYLTRRLRFRHRSTG